MLSLSRLALAFTLSLSLASKTSAISPSFSYGSDKVRGVNLGGWLVLEPWITPSIFDATGNDAIVDEWTFGQYQDFGTAQAALQAHWDSWITEQDFIDIAAAGLNHVRLPIGYWAWEVGPGEPYIQGQLPYLQNAVSWAETHGLKLIIDLHGAPGSQNGYDNSGERLDYPGWHSNATNIARTNAIIKDDIAAAYKDQYTVVSMVEPLNEPAGFYGSDVLAAVKQYYLDSYGNLRYPYDGSSTESNTVVFFHDAYQDFSYWNDFGSDNNLDGVAMDTHIYQVFTDHGVAQSDDEHITTACNEASNVSSFNAQMWTIVGEWTPAMTDCAEYLNGRGIGARYDGTYPGSTYVGDCTGFTGSASSFSDDYKTFLRQSYEAQVTAYETASGWIMWTWKAENADEWSYQAGLANGWIPQDPTSREYPDICG